MEGFLEKVVSKPRLEGRRLGLLMVNTEGCVTKARPNQSPLAFR